MATSKGPSTSTSTDLGRARPRRLGHLSAATGSGVVLVYVVVSQAAVGHQQVGFTEHRLPAVVLAAGLALLAITAVAPWAAAGRRPHAAAALAGAQGAATLPLLASWSGLPDRPAAMLLAVFPLVPVGLLLAYLTWRPRPTMFVSTAVKVLLIFAVAAALTHGLGYDPFADLGCARTCDLVPASLAPLLSTHTAVTLAAALALAADILAVAVAIRVPSMGQPLLLAGVLVGLLGAAGLDVARTTTWGDTTGTGTVILLQAVVPAPLAVAVIATLGQDRLRRRALDALVSALSRPEPLAGLGRSPVRAVQFFQEQGNGWVDVRGEPVEAAGLGCAVLSEPHIPGIRLVLAPRAKEVDVLEALTPATRLALRNAQLSAALRRRLQEVQQSQRRVVEVSDAERHRIERDLHDGAQQRLVGVAFHLRLARNGAGGQGAQLLAAAENDVLGVLANLRRLAHGTLPVALADEGLAAALVELVNESAIPIRTQLQVDDPLPPAAAMAAYVAVATMLAAPELTAYGADASVEVTSTEAGLRVVVSLEGLQRSLDPDTWVEAADRVGALAGRWDVTQALGRLVLEAVIPCG